MRFAKQSKGKKNIAVLLVVAMLLTIMPVAAFAVDGEGGGEPATEATAITLNGGETTTIEKAGLFNVTAQFTTAGMVQWVVGNADQGEAVSTAESTLDDGSTIYTATLTGVELAAEQTITATLTPTDTTVVGGLVATGTVARTEPTKIIAVDAAAETVVGETYTTIQDAINYIAEQEDPTGWTINVAAGEYGRFAVLRKVMDLTVNGVGDETVISTLDGNAIEGWTPGGGAPDANGIMVYADNFLLGNVKIISGTVDKPWYSAAVSAYSESSEKAQNMTVQNCNFQGEGLASHFAIFTCSGTRSFSVQNCSFNGYKDAIEMMCDGTAVDTVTVTGNTFENCSFATHGYYGGVNGNVFTFANNTVKGSSDLRAKVVLQDQTNTGALKANVYGNDFTNAMVGLVNLREDGEIISDVLTANTMDINSCYVEAIEPGTIDFYTSYRANMENGWKVKWDLANASNELDTETLELVKKAMENNEYNNELNITGLPDGTLIKTFTWFKDGIYLVPEEAGSLEISKTVKCDEHAVHDTVFEFKVSFFDADGNELKDIPMHYSQNDTDIVYSGDVISLKDKESITLLDIPVGTKYTIEEINIPEKYTVNMNSQVGSIDKQFEEDKVIFVNDHIVKKPTPPTDPTDPVEPPTTDPDPVDPPEEEITDPDVPLVEPEDPTTEIDEPDVPLIDVPGTPVEEIDEPEVPLGDAPKTGDAAPIVGLVGLLVAAVAGLVVVRRKFN